MRKFIVLSQLPFYVYEIIDKMCPMPMIFMVGWTLLIKFNYEILSFSFFLLLLSSSSDNYWALTADFVVNWAFDPRELVLIKEKAKFIEALISGEFWGVLWNLWKHFSKLFFIFSHKNHFFRLFHTHRALGNLRSSPLKQHNFFITPLPPKIYNRPWIERKMD